MVSTARFPGAHGRSPWSATSVGTRAVAGSDQRQSGGGRQRQIMV